MPMRRFLAATDGTVYGEHAVMVGRALAEQAGGEFMRLAVEAGNSTPGPTPGWSTESAPRGTVTLVRGHPGVEIVRHGETWGVDLIVLGRHQRTPGSPRPLGSTADAVIRRRSGPSLFVPPEIPTVRRATIALDGSLRGLGVVAPAVAFLNLTKARTGAICVLPGMQVEAPDTTAWQDPRSERVRALVNGLELNAGPCDLLVRSGDPVPEILRTIRETSSDLLILGVRRGGQPGDLGSGYVGRELLKSAPCAVLTVPI